MRIENSVVLIIGANRGIGLAFTRALLARGARKIYAAARNPASVNLPGVKPCNSMSPDLKKSLPLFSTRRK